MDFQLKNTFKVVVFEFPEELHDLALGLICDMDFVGVEEIHDTFKVTFHSHKLDDSLFESMFETIKGVYPKVKYVETLEIEEKNWNEDWENSIEPVWIDDNCVITPEWKANDVDANMKIIINPQMSFGTGHHSTTKMMSILALKYVKADSFWVDAGSGTGLLAILASKLGAKEIFAFDNDEWSTLNINENIALNGVLNIRVENADIYKVELPESDGIFANLFLHLVIDSFDKMYESLKRRKGILLVSGILKYDEETVVKSAIKAGFKLNETMYDDEWIAFQFTVE